MASKRYSDDKPELIALYRLEFYKNKRKWKLCSEKTEIRTKSSSNIASSAERKNNLNDTYELESKLEQKETSVSDNVSLHTTNELLNVEFQPPPNPAPPLHEPKHAVSTSASSFPTCSPETNQATLVYTQPLSSRQGPPFSHQTPLTSPQLNTENTWSNQDKLNNNHWSHKSKTVNWKSPPQGEGYLPIFQNPKAFPHKSWTDPSKPNVPAPDYNAWQNYNQTNVTQPVLPHFSSIRPSKNPNLLRERTWVYSESTIASSQQTLYCNSIIPQEFTPDYLTKLLCPNSFQSPSKNHQNYQGNSIVPKANPNIDQKQTLYYEHADENLFVDRTYQDLNNYMQQTIQQKLLPNNRSEGMAGPQLIYQRDLSCDLNNNGQQTMQQKCFSDNWTNKMAGPHLIRQKDLSRDLNNYGQQTDQQKYLPDNWTNEMAGPQLMFQRNLSHDLNNYGQQIGQLKPLTISWTKGMAGPQSICQRDLSRDLNNYGQQTDQQKCRQDNWTNRMASPHLMRQKDLSRDLNNYGQQTDQQKCLPNNWTNEMPGPQLMSQRNLIYDPNNYEQQTDLTKPLTISCTKEMAGPQSMCQRDLSQDLNNYGKQTVKQKRLPDNWTKRMAVARLMCQRDLSNEFSKKSSDLPPVIAPNFSSPINDNSAVPIIRQQVNPELWTNQGTPAGLQKKPDIWINPALAANTGHTLWDDQTWQQQEELSQNCEQEWGSVVGNVSSMEDDDEYTEDTDQTTLTPRDRYEDALADARRETQDSLRKLIVAYKEKEMLQRGSGDTAVDKQNICDVITGQCQDVLSESEEFIRGAKCVPHSSEKDPNDTNESDISYMSTVLVAPPGPLSGTKELRVATILRDLLVEEQRKEQEKQRPIVNSFEYPTRDTDPYNGEIILDGSHLLHNTALLHRNGVIKINMGRPYRL